MIQSFAFVLTILIEFLVVFILFRKDPKKLFFYSVLINAFTHPLATTMFFSFPNEFLLIEIGVFLVEIVLWMKLLEIKVEKAVLLSFVANFVTAGIGLLF